MSPAAATVAAAPSRCIALDSPRICGRSTTMCALLEEVHRLAPTLSSVLLTGETGTGKGLLARAIHTLSPVTAGPLVHVDCAALSPTVIESELFGHERGAFTGAAEKHMGRFEQAAGGTIFLDEIGELPPLLQAKLLRVLHDRHFERIGGGRTLRMDARVIAATNQDLGRAIEEGRFRADLYFRLKVFELNVPPLRERCGDLPELVRNGLAEIAARFTLAVPAVTEGFLARLAAHPWPGNVRELLHLLERLVVTRPGATLEATHLDGLLSESAGRATLPEDRAWVDARVRDLPPREASELREIASVLIETGGNIARAARRLEMPRSSLRHRIRFYGLAALIPRD